MFNLLVILVLALPGALLLVRSVGRRSVGGVIFAAALVLAPIVLAGSAFSFAYDYYWFEELGRIERFLTEIQYRWGISAVASLLSASIAGVLAWHGRSSGRGLLAGLVAGVVGFGLGSTNWDKVLLWRSSSPSGQVDPLLGRDLTFYMFDLPALNFALTLLSMTAVVAVVAVLLFPFGILATAEALRRSGPEGILDISSGKTIPQSGPRRGGRLEEILMRFSGRGGARPVQHHDLAQNSTANPSTTKSEERVAESRPASIRILGVLAIVIAASSFLGRYDLIVSGTGIAGGAGWVDMNVRYHLYAVAAGLWLSWGLFLIVRARSATHTLAGAGFGVLFGLTFVLFAGVSVAAQRLLVSPNEVAREAPYIELGIEGTRVGFGLDRAEERDFPADTEAFGPELLANNSSLMHEVRLWDYRALEQVYEQLQAIRLYYDFTDIDVGRYEIGGETRQIMLSARELDAARLPSRTFENERIRYTHGHGVVASPVSEFTPSGRPNFLVRDLPATSSVPELEITRPEIYYGQLTNGHVYVGTTEDEFGYPSGEENVYERYEGTGGVPLYSFTRRLTAAWNLDGHRLFTSRYFTSDSKALYERNIFSRVRRLAPFVTWDNDAYIVIAEGRLAWIIDGYTTSNGRPYSQTLNFWGRPANHVRNSVKAVVDAYNGSVDLYLFDEEDPVASAWASAYEGLFTPANEMPESLRRHIRYPEALLVVQASVYSRYHMQNVRNFYNQEDLWQRATELYHSDPQTVEPYYVMWQEPGTTHAQFSLMLPFTPRNRQNMIGWMAGLADQEHYGRLLTYQFPKGELVPGPQQFETKIDQDPFISDRMTLWGQSGSRVIRGNVLSLPVGETLIHVEPIYLEAENSAYPELRLVAVMHGESFAYGETFEEAISNLLNNAGSNAAFTLRTGEEPEEDLEREDGVSASLPTTNQADLARRASQAFESYLELQAEGRFEEAARHLTELRNSLDQLVGEAP
ncbi:MAG: UPF0182 family protein [Gemmatimonas sp.]|nr:UPF0182 family protein [Gemmatimonas sp.]